jgi:hypothetical protein
MRFVRLALGTYIGIQAYQTQSTSALCRFLLPPVITSLDAVEPMQLFSTTEEKNNEDVEDEKNNKKQSLAAPQYSKIQ